MRYAISTHLVSSATNAFRMLQTIVDDADLQKAHQHLKTGGTHPNLGGCVDSPEASTLILMLVGTVGIFYGLAALFAPGPASRGFFPGGLDSPEETLLSWPAEAAPATFFLPADSSIDHGTFR